MNLAACDLKLQNYDDVFVDCDAVFAVEGVSPVSAAKAKYRRASASYAKKDLEAALSDVKDGLELVPEEPSLKSLQATIAKAISVRKSREKAMYSRMLG